MQPLPLPGLRHSRFGVPGLALGVEPSRAPDATVAFGQTFNTTDFADRTTPTVFAFDFEGVTPANARLALEAGGLAGGFYVGSNALGNIRLKHGDNTTIGSGTNSYIDTNVPFPASGTIVVQIIPGATSQLALYLDDVDLVATGATYVQNTSGSGVAEWAGINAGGFFTGTGGDTGAGGPETEFAATGGELRIYENETLNTPGVDIIELDSGGEAVIIADSADTVTVTVSGAGSLDGTYGPIDISGLDTAPVNLVPPSYTGGTGSGGVPQAGDSIAYVQGLWLFSEANGDLFKANTWQSGLFGSSAVTTPGFSVTADEVTFGLNLTETVTQTGLAQVSQSVEVLPNTFVAEPARAPDHTFNPGDTFASSLFDRSAPVVLAFDTPAGFDGSAGGLILEIGDTNGVFVGFETDGDYRASAGNPGTSRGLSFEGDSPPGAGTYVVAINPGLTTVQSFLDNVQFGNEFQATVSTSLWAGGDSGGYLAVGGSGHFDDTEPGVTSTPFATTGWGTLRVYENETVA